MFSIYRLTIVSKSLGVREGEYVAVLDTIATNLCPFFLKHATRSLFSIVLPKNTCPLQLTLLHFR
jgi:hypothetical protein